MVQTIINLGSDTHLNVGRWVRIEIAGGRERGEGGSWWRLVCGIFGVLSFLYILVGFFAGLFERPINPASPFIIKRSKNCILERLFAIYTLVPIDLLQNRLLKLGNWGHIQN